MKSDLITKLEELLTQDAGEVATEVRTLQSEYKKLWSLEFEIAKQQFIDDGGKANQFDYTKRPEDIHFESLVDKYGKLKIFTISAILSLIPILFITNMPIIPFYYVLIVTGFWFIVANGRNIAASTMVSNVVLTENRGSFMSINSAIQQLFTGIASIIAGLIVVTKKPNPQLLHYSYVGYLSLILIVCCIFLAKRLKTSGG